MRRRIGGEATSTNGGGLRRHHPVPFPDPGWLLHGYEGMTLWFPSSPVQARGTLITPVKGDDRVIVEPKVLYSAATEEVNIWSKPG